MTIRRGEAILPLTHPLICVRKDAVAKLNPRGAAARKPSKAPSGIEREPVFFGTLRSEFDTEEELDEGWEALAKAAETIRLAYIREELEAKDVASALGQLKLKDRSGAEWTIGASSGEWYRRTSSNNQWLRTPAPSLVTPDLNDAPDWVSEGVAALIPSLGSWGTEGEKETEEVAALSVKKTPLPADLLPAQKATPAFSFDKGDDYEAFLRASDAAEDEPLEVAPVQGPAPRVNSVTSSDLLGWQPSKRSDGPELPELEPMIEPMAELEEIAETERVPVEFGYASLVEQFEDDLQPQSISDEEVAVAKGAPEATETPGGSEGPDDDFRLPDDLFYRPPGH